MYVLFFNEWANPYPYILTLAVKKVHVSELNKGFVLYLKVSSIFFYFHKFFCKGLSIIK